MSENYILITGAASGMGREAAIRFSAEHNLALIDRDLEKLNETLSLCSFPEKHKCMICDLSLVENVFNKMKEFLTGDNITVETFIHFAGITHILPIKNFELKQSQQIFNINFFSAVEIIRALLKKNINKCVLQNIVFISSLWSKLGEKGSSMYGASKGALDALVKNLAVELAPETRVNSILPGGIRTPMSEAAFNNPEIMAKVKHDYLLGIGEKEDIVNFIEFLISKKARWVTGQNIIIDGGKTAH